MIKKEEQNITDLKSWEKYAGPKSNSHWKNHRSAVEVAKAWLEVQSPSFPVEVQKILLNHKDFDEVLSWQAEPEKLVYFDKYKGPANIDLLIFAEDKKGKFVIGLEAKADEPFGQLVSEVFTDALERMIKNNLSKGIDRIEQLVISLFKAQKDNRNKIGNLRYQLLTAIAGTIKTALTENVDRSIFLVHEFRTPKTSIENLERNQNDLKSFIERLSAGAINVINDSTLYGPFCIPGKPLFNKSPNLYIGKAVRNINA